MRDSRTTVPVDEGQGVSEWKLPMARTGLGYRSISRRTACSSATLAGVTTVRGLVVMPPS